MQKPTDQENREQRVEDREHAYGRSQPEPDRHRGRSSENRGPGHASDLARVQDRHDRDNGRERDQEHRQRRMPRCRIPYVRAHPGHAVAP